MKITVIPAKELTREHVADWVDWQTANRTIDSPFFRPEFTQAVAEVCDNIEVAIFEVCGSLAGFFAFYRSSDNVGWPVPMSEYQGLILRPGVTVDVQELVRGCRLSAWNFNAVVAAQRDLQPFHWVRDSSPYIDTTMTFDEYLAKHRRAGGETLPKTLRKLRSMQREVGVVRFEMDTDDERVLETLIAWKSKQFLRSRLFDFFSRDWTKRLFVRLLQDRDAAFRGTLSALYVNDQIQAILYGLRSRHVLHTWVTAYGPQVAKYSPGYQLLVKLIQAAPGQGIERIDLSKGSERHKQSFMTGATSLATGSVDSRALRMVWHMGHRVHARLRLSPLAGALRVPWRLIKRTYEQARFP